MDFYVASEGMQPRDGGPYLDQQAAKRAEDERAALEGREPDYEANRNHVGAHRVSERTLRRIGTHKNINPSMPSEVATITVDPLLAPGETGEE